MNGRTIQQYVWRLKPRLQRAKAAFAASIHDRQVAAWHASSLRRQASLFVAAASAARRRSAHCAISHLLLLSPLLSAALAGCGRGAGGVRPVAVAKAGARAHAPAIPPRFVDVTAAAGIDFKHENAHTSRRYMIETFGGGCAFIDYDGDGWPDVLLLNGRALPGSHVAGRPNLKLYHNNHNGTFTDVTTSAGLADKPMYAMGVAVGDYDNDGREDFYVSCVLGPGHLFHNEGGGRFRDVTKEAGVGNDGNWGTSCAWLDYDRDGKLDLFVCNYVQYPGLAADLPCISGPGYVYCIPTAYKPSHCVLYHNDGKGRFHDASAEAGIAAAHGKSLGVAIWDCAGDGWPDIFVANDTEPSFLFRNDHHGHFTEDGVAAGMAYNDSGVAHSGMGIDVADARNDGRAELLITNYYGQETSYYEQTAPKSSLFVESRGAAGIGAATHRVLGFGVKWLDVDNSGWKAFVQVNGHVQDDVATREPDTQYREPTLLFRNNADGTYSEVGQSSGAPFTDAIVGRGVAVGDFDNDGRLDVLVGANGGRAMLWRNETPTTDHWLTLKLVGKKSDRDGIGAVVKVTADGVTQRTMVRSGSSYIAASDLRPHFGLASAPSAEVEIDWPSGTIDRLHNVASDQILNVVEGAAGT